MANDTMVAEYPDEKQRYAVCESQWEKSKENKAMANEHIERRFLPQDKAGSGVRVREDGSRVIFGHAAVFYDGSAGTEYELWDGVFERIMPGTFKRAIREDDVVAAVDHDTSRLLGRKSNGTLRLAEDDRGLYYEADPPDTTAAGDAVKLLDRGDIRGSSFQFRTTDESWEKEDDREVRVIRGVQLYDVGPVARPAYASTTAGVRSEARASYDTWKAQETADEQRQAAEEAERRKRADQDQAETSARVTEIATLG